MCNKRSLFLPVLIAITFLPVQFSCNKDTEDVTSIPALPPPEPFTEEELTTMDSIGIQAVRLYRNTSASFGEEEAARQVVTWALTQPYVADAASEDNGKIVYIEYESGALDAIYETPDTEPGAHPKIDYGSIINNKDASQFPEKPSAIIYNGAFNPGEDAQVINEMNALIAVNYNVTLIGGEYNPPFNVASLDSMRKMHYDIVCFASHGRYLGWAGGSCIQTAEFVDRSSIQDNSGLWREGLIIRHLDLAETIPLRYWLFTPTYVRWCRFGQNTFALLSACETLKGTELADAFREAGLDACIGWRGKDSTKYAPNAIQALFDLLTARRTLISTTSIPAEIIPIGNKADDPFNLEDALNILHKLDYGTVTQSGALLDIAYGWMWGLMPHLDDYTTTSSDITLTGSFGSEEGEVVLENESGSPIISLSVISWSESEIRCQMPEENLSGNLVVYVRGLKSNPLPLASGQWIFNWGNSGTRYFDYPDSWNTTSAVITPDGVLGMIFNAYTKPSAAVTVENIAAVTPGTEVECSMYVSYDDSYASSPFSFSDTDPWLRTYVTFDQIDFTTMGKISGSFSGKLGIYHPMDPFHWETVDIITAPFTVTYLGQEN